MNRAPRARPSTGQCRGLRAVKPRDSRAIRIRRIWSVDDVEVADHEGHDLHELGGQLALEAGDDVAAARWWRRASRPATTPSVPLTSSPQAAEQARLAETLRPRTSVRGPVAMNGSSSAKTTNGISTTIRCAR